MVTCKLWGRLGNQMFMIAATIGYAKKHGLEYHIPPVSMNPRIWKTYFPHLVNRNYKKHLPVIQIHEQAHSYQELEFKEEWRNCNIELIGYWQSEKYFNEYREDIVKNIFPGWFMPSYQLGYCALHIRIGDYKLYPDKHPIVTLDYIREAVTQLCLITGGLIKFIVYTDEIKEAKKKLAPLLSSGFEISFFDDIRGSVGSVSDFMEIVLMASAEHIIISNSTFSWWAAWLNDRPNRIVIAPQIWFGPGNSHLDTKDLIPDTWKKI